MVGSLIVLIGLTVAPITRSTAPSVDRPKGDVKHLESRATDRAALAKVETAIDELKLIRPSPPRPAKDFTLKTPAGGVFRLTEHRGQVVFINFWATWCPPCREEMPAMERLLRQTKKDGLVMLAVSVDADPRQIVPFLAEHDFTFAIGLDPKMELADAYGVRALPASFIVDREEYLVASALGPRDWDTPATRALVAALSR